MSSFGKSVGSILPADIEERLASVQETISRLDGQIIIASREVEEKKKALETLNVQLAGVKAEYDKKVSDSAAITTGLKERETKLSQKESALDVYANALKEKEERINKYLNVFENMKGVISK